MNKSTNFSLILFYLVSEIKFIQVLLFLKVPNIKELCKSSHHCWPWAEQSKAEQGNYLAQPCSALLNSAHGLMVQE